MYDLIIIGGSASGAAAGVYAARRQLKFLVIAKDLGGEVALSGEIANWIGTVHTTGIDLASQFATHLKSYQPEILEGYLVTQITKPTEGLFVVTTDDGKEYESKAVVLAAGAHSRELGIPGEKEFRLKGVSYCTVCDGPLFAGKTTVVIGGGNSALEAALMLADLCPQVYVINKNLAFKGEQIMVTSLQSKKNVTIIAGVQTLDIFGQPGGFAQGLHYQDQAGTIHELAFDGAFVHIGQVPNSQMVPAACAKDTYGYVVVGLDGATSVPGLFAAGDITNAPHKQIVIAAGMGATAALSAVQYINRLS